jgi:hypothetical protein
MKESLLTISQFKKLMMSLKLKESFEDCIRDFRKDKLFVFEELIEESEIDTRITKI